MDSEKTNIKTLIDNELPLPIYFNFLTEVIRDEDRVVKIELVESCYHQTKMHIPQFFYKPICRISNEE